MWLADSRLVKFRLIYLNAVLKYVSVTRLKPESKREWEFVLKDKKWSYFLDNFYKVLENREITRLAAGPVLDSARFKFAYSYTWAGEYWSVVRKWEKKILKVGFIFSSSYYAVLII